MAHFKDRLLSILEDRDMTQKELALKTNITPATISRYISGNHNPSAENAKRIACELGVSVDWLMGVSNLSNTQQLSKKEKADIAKDLDEIKQQLLDSDELMFDGMPMDEESITKILSALEVGMEMVRKKNKEKYTPKKYKR
ncbi:helix-turn-helix transcriptional regulator [Zhenhengia sp.]|uniref:helix-turn-helix domain-containing protein n=1 Tax=Zhenhengia sp. TaxID=2944208 RepID=UPI003078C31A|nr:helix-turn-helix transcriptional regulator [Clostridiales bacterium]